MKNSKEKHNVMATQAIAVPYSPTFNPVPGDLIAGLQNSPKSIPTHHLYGSSGMELYHKICELSAYYPIRAEEELLQSPAMMTMLLEPLNDGEDRYVASLGPGKGRKDAFTLNHMVNHFGLRCTWNPIDVCVSACKESANLVTKFVDNDLLTIDYRANGQQFLSGLQTSRGIGMKRLVTYFGSTISNFEPPFNLSHLAAIAQEMNPDDYLLMGVDMMHPAKPIATIEAAYNNQPTKEWVLNVLNRINRKLRTNLRQQDFTCKIFFDEQISGIRTVLVANKEIEVWVPSIEQMILFAADEEIQIEVSIKYTEQAFEELIEAAGLEIVNFAENEEHRFNLYLLRTVRA